MDAIDDFTDAAISDLILNYLNAQAEIDGECFSSEKIITSADIVKDILAELMDKVQKIVELKEEYEFNVEHHNQYPLFDLREKIDSFDIDDSLYNSMIFRESMLVGVMEKYDAEPKPCGGLCLDVQAARGAKPLKRITPDLFKEQIFNKVMSKMHMDFDKDIKCNEDLYKYSLDLLKHYEEENSKFLVHFSCKFDAQGSDAGVRITTWVDRNFHTIEEGRTEFIMENDQVHTEKLYVALQEGKYYVRHKSSLSNLEQSRFYTLTKAKHYISEGANFVLLRYLAITRFVGILQMSCAYINGDLCLNDYDCMGPESGWFNGKKLDVCRIYRKVTEECGIIHLQLAYLSLEGQLLKQEWKNSAYIYYINPKAKVENAKPRNHVRILLTEDWQDDLQLYSKYLDVKLEHQLHVKSYLAQHPEIHNLISEYVQQILQVKPNDVVQFTINYFSSFAPTYFERFTNTRMARSVDHKDSFNMYF